jgi:hypothetical protein
MWIPVPEFPATGRGSAASALGASQSEMDNEATASRRLRDATVARRWVRSCRSLGNEPKGSGCVLRPGAALATTPPQIPDTIPMDHFRTYLRAELARLKSESVASGLPNLPECGGLTLEPGGPQAVAARFETQDRTDSFVSRLTDDELICLTQCLSRWRNNSVSSDLKRSQTAVLEGVAVGLIRLNDAEALLHDAFVRNGRLLTRIASDPEVLADPNFAKHSPGEPVNLPICLAKPDPEAPGKFRVIDGVHRAIQLVRNGESSILLCVFRPALPLR